MTGLAPRSPPPRDLAITGVSRPRTASPRGPRTGGARRRSGPHRTGPFAPSPRQTQRGTWLRFGSLGARVSVWVRACVWFGVGFWLTSGALAQTPAPDTHPSGPAESGLQIRRLLVPANAPEQWPAGEWEPFPAQRFEQLLESARRRQAEPGPPTLRSAVYRATVHDNRLIDGEVTWELTVGVSPAAAARAGVPPTRLLPLGDCPLPLWDVRSQPPEARDPTSPLPWGRSEEGQLWLLTHRATTTVTAQFGLDGRHVGQFWHWRLRMPAALRTRWELRVPAGLQLAVSRGLVTGPLPLPPDSATGSPTAVAPTSPQAPLSDHPAASVALTAAVPSEGAPPAKAQPAKAQPAKAQPANGPPAGAAPANPADSSVLWQIDLGSETECELQLFPEPVIPPTGVLLSRSDLSLVVRPEATRFRAVFDLTPGERPLQTIEWEIPSAAEIASVRWGEEWLPWERPTDRRDRLRVHFPDAWLGESRRVELLGLIQAEETAPWSLPVLRVRDALDLGGPLIVRTVPPLRVARWTADGLRAVGMQATPEGSETFEFVQVSPAPQLTLEPEAAPERPTIRQIEVLGGSADEDLVACFEWSVPQGQVWSAHLQVAPGWEVVDVRALSEGRGERGLDWQATPNPEGVRLDCQFAEALSPQRPFAAQVSLRARNSPEGEAPRLPAIVPTDLRPAEYSLLAVGAAPPTLAAGSVGFQPLPLNQLPDWLEPLGLASRTEPAVWRLPGVSRAAPVQLAPPRQSAVSTPAGTSADVSGTVTLPPPAETPPRALLRVHSLIDLAGASRGYDRYRLEWELPASWPAGPLHWRLDPRIRDIACFINNQPAIPLTAVPGYDGGIAVPVGPPASPPLPRRLRLEYRVPLDATSPGQRHLLFPQFADPVLESTATLRVAPGQVLLSPPPGFLQRQPLAGDAPQPLRPLLGRWLDPQIRTVPQPWWVPFRGDNWRELLRRLGPTADLEDPLDLAEQWQSRQLGLPVELPLAVARRDVTLVSGLLCLLLGCLTTLALRRVTQGAHPLWVGLILVALSVSLPWWSADWGQALTALATGLLVGLGWPHRWLARPTRLAAISPASPPSRWLSPTSTATTALIGGALLVATQFGLPLALSQPPLIPPPPPGVRGDVLVPLADNPSAAPPQVVYLPATLRQQLEQLAAPPLPGVLIQDLELDTPLDGQGRQLLVARLQCWLTGHGPPRLLLPLAGVRLSESNPCLVDGQPVDLLPTAHADRLLLTLGSETPPSPPVSASGTPDAEEFQQRPDPPCLPDQLEPAPEAAERAAERSGSSVWGRPVEVVLRLLPIPALPGEPVPELQLPPAGSLRAPPGDSAAAGALHPAGGAVAVASRPDCRQIEGTTGTWHWQTADDLRTAGSSPPRLSATVRVDLGRRVARMQAVIRCRPGSEPYAGLAVRLPAGLHLLTTRSDTPLQTQLHPHPEGSRRLDLQFIQPVTASETIELTLVQGVTPGELELLLPEPVESWPATGLPGLLTECRVGLFPAPDLQLSVRSTVADLPLHSWLTFPTEWQEGWRGTGGPFAYELDTAQHIRLELLPRSPSIDAQLEQRGELQAEQIAWTWRAEQVQCDPPQLQYTLQVDPRLTVTGVDVRNDQASVLQRWSRSGEQLTLLLTGPATPGQTIELQGQLPLPVALRDGLPTVRLEFATPQIERRVLLALPDVPVRLEAPNWVETQAEGLRVLFDAPVSPRAEWPRLELPTREEPDRPAAPTEPEGPPAVTADSPSETNEPRITDAELAELLLHETSDSWWQGRLTVWLPPGEGCWWELHWPPGAKLQGLDWQGAAPPTRESPSGLAVRLPERKTAGRLVLHWRWSAPAVAPAGREWWRPVPPLPLVWPRQTRVARLLFTTSDPALENWPFGGSLRSLPGPEAVRLVRETDRRLALDPAPETAAADPLPDPLAAWLLGNARLTQTLQQTGQWNRRHAWSGRTWSRPWTALLLAIAALVVCLTRRWWPSLQAQTPWAVLLLGCLTWVGLSGSAGGALLALIALPFALLTSVGPRR